MSSPTMAPKFPRLVPPRVLALTLTLLTSSLTPLAPQCAPSPVAVSALSLKLHHQFKVSLGHTQKQKMSMFRPGSRPGSCDSRVAPSVDDDGDQDDPDPGPNPDPNSAPVVPTAPTPIIPTSPTVPTPIMPTLPTPIPTPPTSTTWSERSWFSMNPIKIQFQPRTSTNRNRVAPATDLVTDLKLVLGPDEAVRHAFQKEADRLRERRHKREQDMIIAAAKAKAQGKAEGKAEPKGAAGKANAKANPKATPKPGPPQFWDSVSSSSTWNPYFDGENSNSDSGSDDHEGPSGGSQNQGQSRNQGQSQPRSKSAPVASGKARPGRGTAASTSPSHRSRRTFMQRLTARVGPIGINLGSSTSSRENTVTPGGPRSNQVAVAGSDSDGEDVQVEPQEIESDGDGDREDGDVREGDRDVRNGERPPDAPGSDNRESNRSNTINSLSDSTEGREEVAQGQSQHQHGQAAVAVTVAAMVRRLERHQNQMQHRNGTHVNESGESNLKSLDSDRLRLPITVCSTISGGGSASSTQTRLPDPDAGNGTLDNDIKFEREESKGDSNTRTNTQSDFSHSSDINAADMNTPGEAGPGPVDVPVDSAGLDSMGSLAEALPSVVVELEAEDSGRTGTNTVTPSRTPNDGGNNNNYRTTNLVTFLNLNYAASESEAVPVPQNHHQSPTAAPFAASEADNDDAIFLDIIDITENDEAHRDYELDPDRASESDSLRGLESESVFATPDSSPRNGNSMRMAAADASSVPDENDSHILDLNRHNANGLNSHINLTSPSSRNSGPAAVSAVPAAVPAPDPVNSDCPLRVWVRLRSDPATRTADDLCALASRAACILRLAMLTKTEGSEPKGASGSEPVGELRDVHIYYKVVEVTLEGPCPGASTAASGTDGSKTKDDSDTDPEKDMDVDLEAQWQLPQAATPEVPIPGPGPTLTILVRPLPTFQDQLQGSLKFAEQFGHGQSDEQADQVRQFELKNHGFRHGRGRNKFLTAPKSHWLEGLAAAGLGSSLGLGLIRLAQPKNLVLDLDRGSFAVTTKPKASLGFLTRGITRVVTGKSSGPGENMRKSEIVLTIHDHHNQNHLQVEPPPQLPTATVIFDGSTNVQAIASAVRWVEVEQLKSQVTDSDNPSKWKSLACEVVGVLFGRPALVLLRPIVGDSAFNMEVVPLSAHLDHEYNQQNSERESDGGSFPKFQEKKFLLDEADVEDAITTRFDLV